MTKTGTGRWIVSGENTFTGGVPVNQGTLSVSSINEVGVAGPLGMNSTIQLGGRHGADTWGAYIGSNNSGTLEYTGSGQTSGRSFQIGSVEATSTGAGTIANNGTGALTFTAAEFNPTITGITATRSLTLGGSNDGTIEGMIQDNSETGKVAVTKAGDGIWKLEGDNEYTGNTIVNAGTLLINGDQSPAIGAVAVNGTSTLGGSGTIGGSVTVAAGANLAPGSSVGTLSVGGALNISATAGGAGKLNFELGSIAASDRIAVTESAGGLVLTFQMLDATARGTAVLKLEHSNSLATSSWTTVPVPDASSTVDDVVFTITGTGPLNVTATIPASKAASGKLFGRLKAQNP